MIDDDLELFSVVNLLCSNQ